MYLGGAMPGRWRGGGPSRSPTVDGGDKPQSCRTARHRATPRSALKRPSRPHHDRCCWTFKRGRRLPWAVFRVPLDRRTPTTPLFSAHGAESTARARSTPTPGVATPLSHATPSPTPSSRLPIAVPRLVSCLVFHRRAVPRGFFTPTGLRRPATKDASAASASLCGERDARHRGVIRHRHEGDRGREVQRRKCNWKHPRGRFATLLIHAARFACFSLRAIRRNASAISPLFLAFIS